MIIAKMNPNRLLLGSGRVGKRTASKIHELRVDGTEENVPSSSRRREVGQRTVDLNRAEALQHVIVVASCVCRPTRYNRSAKACSDEERICSHRICHSFACIQKSCNDRHLTCERSAVGRRREAVYLMWEAAEVQLLAT